MKVYIFLVGLWLAFLPLNCFAFSSPSETIHDTIQQQKDEVMSDFRYEVTIAYKETMKKFKSGFKTLLTFVVETGTVIAIGWCFTFLVDKQTAKMIKLLLLIGGLTAIIKFLNQFMDFVNSA